MSIAYYISSHGMGHAARAIQVLRALPERIGLHLKSMAPEWFFWQEVRRPFTYTQDSFDCGVLETDSKGVDRLATLKTYATVAERNSQRIEAEVEWLRSIGARLVVSDVAAFPIKVAQAAGIPGILVGNFTWLDIYRPYMAKFPDFSRFLGPLEEQYRATSVAFITPPALPMEYLPAQTPVPMMARRGRNLRKELCAMYGIDPSRPLVLFYLGNLGMRFHWRSMEALSEYTFLTFSTLRGVRPKNLVTLEQGVFDHPDVVASVDVVAAKAGYGMVGECMANGTPMLYMPRDHFAEFPALDQALQDWGGALRIPQKDFSNVRWADGLRELISRERPLSIRSDGGQVVADALVKMMED